MPTIIMAGPHPVIVDDEDAEWLAQFSWHTHAMDRRYAGSKRYACHAFWRESGSRANRSRHVNMHHFLMDAHPRGSGVVIDHINRDSLDNRRANLRYASLSENARNSDKTGKRPRK